MPYEIDCFTYLYSTYKFNTDRLKEELAKGNEELQRYGEISAEIQGYRTLYSTQILAKVKLTISYKGVSESRYEYVTFIASEDELLLMPEDCSMMDCWDYKYRY